MTTEQFQVDYKREFIVADLNNFIEVKKKFDLALCLEVAEHMHPESAKNIVRTLTKASNIVVFSAAIPLQGGQNHFKTNNGNLFEQQGYTYMAGLRSVLWQNQSVEFWYKQNIGIFVNSAKAEIYQSYKGDILLKDVVHPENYFAKVKYLQIILSGKKPVYFYIYLLWKWLLNFFR